MVTVQRPSRCNDEFQSLQESSARPSFVWSMVGPVGSVGFYSEGSIYVWYDWHGLSDPCFDIACYPSTRSSTDTLAEPRAGRRHHVAGTIDAWLLFMVVPPLTKDVLYHHVFSVEMQSGVFFGWRVDYVSKNMCVVGFLLLACSFSEGHRPYAW